MRHRKGFNHLGRKSAHRKAMLSNMASSLIKHKRIQTTTAKAKALRSYIEPLITKSKNDTTHSRRVVFSYLQDKDAVSELFREVSPKVMERPGGYTRILKLGSRLGDSAEMAIIELVDFNPNLISELSETKSTGTRRRGRRGGKKKSTGEETQQPVEATAQETDEQEVKDEKAPQTEAHAEDQAAENIATVDDSAETKANEDEKPAAEEKKEDTPAAEASEETSGDKKEATPEASAEEKAGESEGEEKPDEKSDNKKDS